MTNEELLDIVKMRLNGRTLAEIGEKYGMTASGISRAIRSISGRGPHVCRAGQTRMYDQIIYPMIRARMEDRKWSMNALANKTGISRQGLYNILYGDTLRPQTTSQRAIAKALDMSVEDASWKE